MPPKAKQKVVQQQAQVEEREILYPTLEIIPAFGDRAITVAKAKELLGWETESEFVARKKREDPKLEEDYLRKVFDVQHMLVDETGEKVVCWNSLKNRKYRERWSKTLTQEVLAGHWTGPRRMPGETVNGSTIVVSRTGQVKQGNHSLTCLVRAGQRWAGTADYKSIWPEEPYIETIVVLGVSDSQRVTQTMDFTLARTLADTLFTSSLFADLPRRERDEGTRMMQKCIELLWRRTGAGEVGGVEIFETPSEQQSFIDRHPRIEEAVKVIFDLNRDRAISNLKLSPGHSAALLYLMAASATDGAEYRAGKPRSEKDLNLSRWGKAKDFWTQVVAKRPTSAFDALRTVLGGLVHEDTGEDARPVEKFVVLAKAWAQFIDNHTSSRADLELDWAVDPETQVRRLHEWVFFEGVDVGEPKKGGDGDDPSPEEVRRRQAEIDLARVRGGRAPGEDATLRSPGAAGPVIAPAAPPKPKTTSAPPAPAASRNGSPPAAPAAAPAPAAPAPKQAVQSSSTPAPAPAAKKKPATAAAPQRKSNGGADKKPAQKAKK